MIVARMIVQVRDELVLSNKGSGSHFPAKIRQTQALAGLPGKNDAESRANAGVQKIKHGLDMHMIICI